MTLYFDMDGTIANFYGVENWLEYLINEDTTPYRIAKPLVNMSVLARTLHQLQNKGVEIGIVSWLSKNGTPQYNRKVSKVKKQWLAKHLPSVDFNEIHILKYGVEKSSVVWDNDCILFDDEEQNRKNWNGKAYNVDNIINDLRKILNEI